MLKAIEWKVDHLFILDQTRLPFEERYIQAKTFNEVAKAIQNMEVRGAPAIGAAAAYGYALGAIYYEGGQEGWTEYMEQVRSTLHATRPTATNLNWALRRMEDRFREALLANKSVPEELLAEAHKIAEEDRRVNHLIGQNGNANVPEGARIYTHCNTGNLATVEYGTALGVIRSAWNAGKKIHVFVGETRPFMQGARLTASELAQDQIPYTLVTDSMAGYLMQQGKIDLVLVGADRVAANGDIANKIGTYSLAVLACQHEIPFYVAAPTSSIDLNTSNGDEIPIEERDGDEVRMLMGQRVVPQEVPVYNPSFDITPAKYIAGIITEKGIIVPPYSVNLLKMLLK